MRKKTKIIFINDSYHSGGVEKIMQELVNHMPENEYEITIQTNSSGKDFWNYYNKNISYYQVNLLSSKFYKKNILLYKVIRKVLSYLEKKVRLFQINNKYDIAVAFKEGASLNYVAKTKIRKFAWIHINYDAEHWTQRYYKDKTQEYEIMRKFEKVICVSESVKRGVENLVGKLENLIVLMNPIDEKNVRERAQLENVENIFIKNKISFLCVGRLNFAKAYDRLVFVSKRLERIYDNFQIYIIGQGEEEKKIKALIEKENVNSIKLLGPYDNPYPYMKKTDWFLCCSIFEGFCTVLQEALILEKPVITTDVGGARELFGDSEYGIVVENTEDALFNAMENVIKNSNIQKYYSAKVKERANIINVEESVNKILALFKGK